MDKKIASLLVALLVLVLFLFLEETGVIDVHKQGASAGDSADVVPLEEAVAVDTTPRAVERVELRNVPGGTMSNDTTESGATSQNSSTDIARADWTQSLIFYPVVRAVDGDTIVIFKDGKNETVRLVGVDTPETLHPSRPVECFGREASAFTRALITEAGEVALEVDESQGERDKYGRLLGYVVLPDGRNLNALIIYEGYGYEYTYGTTYAYQAEFILAEELAREAKHGLWGDGVCE